MYNKKAQGEIITTVLIILLVLAAVVIVWQVVKSTVTEGTSTIGEKADCLDVNFKILKATTSEITIRREAGGPETINAVVLIDGKINYTISSIKELETNTSTATYPTKSVEVAGKIGTTQCEISAADTIAAA